jgi:rare lipoprotein A (peptidoglycan hydrolase)
MRRFARLVVIVWLMAGAAIGGGCTTSILRGHNRSVAGAGATFRNDHLRYRAPAGLAPAYQQPRHLTQGDKFVASAPAPAPVYPRGTVYGRPNQPVYETTPRKSGRQVRRDEVARGQMTFKPEGDARRQSSQTERPAQHAAPKYLRSGLASWMGGAWVGHTTVTGEAFDPKRLTAGHATLPVPSYLYVTNGVNGRTILVRVNDRVPARKERVLAISQMSANLLGFRSLDRVEVDLQYAGPAGGAGEGRHEIEFLKSQPWFRRDMLQGGKTASARTDAGPTGVQGQTSPRFRSPVN